MNRILLMDLNSCLHTLKYGFGKGRVSSKEKHNFIIHAFLFKINALMRKSKADVVVYALDSERSLRKEIYADYKEKRKNNKTKQQIELDELAYPQFKEITDYVIPTLGYMNVFGADGYEADDVIGRICKSYANTQIIIYSTDHDMYQLLTPNVCILDPRTDGFYSIESFKKQFKLEPKMWKRVKAIGGCASDEVKGVPIPQKDSTKKQRHVAEKGAINYLTGKMQQTNSSYLAIKSEEGKRVINRNKKLVILPFKGTPEFKIRPDRLRKKGLIAVCKRYGFKAILSDIDTWKQSMRLR